MQDAKAMVSRRTFLGGAAGLAAASIAPGRVSAAAPSRPDSTFGGVSIGATTCSFRLLPNRAEDLLRYVTQCGISSVELGGHAAERFARAATNGRGGASRAGHCEALLDGFKTLRKMYNDAGVTIHAVRFGDIGNPGMTDAQIDFYFLAAKALGAVGITRDLAEAAAIRLGPIADKHEMVVGFSNPRRITPTTYDGSVLTHGEYLGISLDIGQYVANTGEPAFPQIEKHRNRIFSVQLKDCTKNGSNVPFGEGDADLVAVLRSMKKHSMTFPANIRLDYPIPHGSDAVEEVKRCVQFCRNALTAENAADGEDAGGNQKYVCTFCGWVYDPAKGDPDGGIPPGTPFADLPEDWSCPKCRFAKALFSPHSE